MYINLFIYVVCEASCMYVHVYVCMYVCASFVFVVFVALFPSCFLLHVCVCTLHVSHVMSRKVRIS